MTDTQSTNTGGDAPLEAQQGLRMAVGIASLLLVLAFAGTCWWVGHARGSSPAFVRVIHVTRTTDGSTATFTAEVENTGDDPASQVLVRGIVADADPIDHEIDFLSPGERHEVTFVGARDTSPGDVHVHIKAWSDEN